MNPCDMTEEEKEEEFGRCCQCGDFCFCPDPSGYMIQAYNKAGISTGYGCSKCTDEYSNKFPKVDRRKFPINSKL